MKQHFKDIIIIGAGKVAFSLTAALCRDGMKPSLILSKNLDSAKKLAEKFKIKQYSSDLNTLLGSDGIFILAVPDVEITSIAKLLSEIKLDFKNSYFFHLSGALDLSAMAPLTSKKANTGTLHIMQSFPSTKPVEIANSFAGIEFSNKKTKEILEQLSNKLKLIPFAVEAKGKPFYHIAGVFVSNFLIANYYTANAIFSKSGVTSVPGIQLLSPILKATIKNINKNGIVNSLSGPIDRGDYGTIETHLKILRKLKDRESFLLYSYVVQSLMLLQVVKEKYGTLKPAHKKIEKLLTGELDKIPGKGKNYFNKFLSAFGVMKKPGASKKR